MVVVIIMLVVLIIIPLGIIVQKEPEAEADHLVVGRVLQADMQLGYQPEALYIVVVVAIIAVNALMARLMVEVAKFVHVPRLVARGKATQFQRVTDCRTQPAMCVLPAQKATGLQAPWLAHHARLDMHPTCSEPKQPKPAISARLGSMRTPLLNLVVLIVLAASTAVWMIMDLL